MPKPRRTFIRTTESFRSRPFSLSAGPLQRARLKAPDYTTTETPAEPAVLQLCGKGKRKKIRKPCDVELAFIGQRLSTRFGVQPGSYLRVCKVQGKAGLLIPVDDHRDAMAKSRVVCACQAQGESAESCARRVNWQGQLGRGNGNR